MIKTTLMAAVLTAAAFVLPGSASAGPATTALPSLAKQGASNIELVQSRRYKRRNWYYDRGRYGSRFRYRHGPYAYYRGGWWYPRPWWNTPAYAVGIGGGYYGGGYGGGYGGDYDDVYGGDSYGDEAYVGGGGDEHVQYCLNRYRTYNPRTDLFRGYDGYLHHCDSPY